MDSETIWRHIDTERLNLAHILEPLPQAAWDQPSLCEGWRVRDVGTHLALSHLRLRDMVKPAVRSRFRLNAMTNYAAVHSPLTHEQIVATLRGFVGSGRRVPFVTELEPLLDILVHSQDTCVPLGIEHPMPIDAASAAADRVLSLRGPLRLWDRPNGLRLVASDADWAYGVGAVHEASMQAHLLTLTGRQSSSGSPSSAPYRGLEAVSTSDQETVMNEAEAWTLIDDHRVRLTDILDDLSEQEWCSASLCPGWTVRDVAAHLTFAEGRVASIGAGLVALARCRGNLDVAIRDSAVGRTWPTERIIAAIRAMVGSNRHAPGVTSRETMIDILVHGQDMMLPLGRHLEINPAAAAEAANRPGRADFCEVLPSVQDLEPAAPGAGLQPARCRSWCRGVAISADRRSRRVECLSFVGGAIAAQPRAGSSGSARCRPRAAVPATLPAWNRDASLPRPRDRAGSDRRAVCHGS